MDVFWLDIGKISFLNLDPPNIVINIHTFVPRRTQRLTRRTPDAQACEIQEAIVYFDDDDCRCFPESGRNNIDDVVAIPVTRFAPPHKQI